VAAGLLLIGGVVAYRYYPRESRRAIPPDKSTAPPSAVFTTLEGKIEVRAAGSLQWVSADASTVLNKNDKVRAGAGASAEIKFLDGTVIHLRPGSLVTIEEADEEPSSRRQRVAATIQSGVVLFSTRATKPPGSSTTFNTSVSKTTPQGEAAGNITVAERGDSAIKIFRGAATTETSSGQHVDIAANQGLTVDSSGKAGPKVALPAAPALLAPTDLSEITIPNPHERRPYSPGSRSTGRLPIVSFWIPPPLSRRPSWIGRT